MEASIRSRLIHGVAAPERSDRRFGRTAGVGMILVMGVLVPLVQWRHPSVWPWAAGAFLILLAVLSPQALGSLHRLAVQVARLVRVVITTLLMVVLYALVITPMAVLLRVTRRRDLLTRNFDGSMPSYRILPAHSTPADLERPF